MLARNARSRGVERERHLAKRSSESSDTARWAARSGAAASTPVGDLVAGVPGVRYLQLPQRASIGAKRNLACAEARGELIAHWDDDDWYAPARLSW